MLVNGISVVIALKARKQFVKVVLVTSSASRIEPFGYFVVFDSTSKVRLREKVTDKAQLPIC
jgi:hypothetical protein